MMKKQRNRKLDLKWQVLATWQQEVKQCCTRQTISLFDYISPGRIEKFKFHAENLFY